MRHLYINPGLTINGSELKLSFSRSSGAGGQNVNKVNSKATLRWNVTASKAISEHAKTKFIARFRNQINNEGEFITTASEYRDQEKNIQSVHAKLRAAILGVLKKEKKRIKTKPHKGSREARIKTKKVIKERKTMRKKVGFND